MRTVLGGLHLQEDAVIHDPWNGSGTTTAVAAMMGFRSIGFDVNPALSIIAAARTATREEAIEVLQAIKALEARPPKGKRSAAIQLTAIFHRLHLDTCTLAETYENRRVSLILCILFRAARTLAKPSRASNPTWYKISPLSQPTTATDVLNEVKRQADIDLDSISWRQSSTPAPMLHTVNSCIQHLPDETIDAVVTSPPYLTRIDYVKATLPELQLLSLIFPDLDELDIRRKMIGSPLVGRTAPMAIDAWGRTASDCLGLISSHPSKASNGYYLRFYLRYFHSLFVSLSSLFESLKPSGFLSMVTQTSHYKEVFIDLPQIVEEMALAIGYQRTGSSQFHQSRSFVTLNAKSSRTLSCVNPIEQISIFLKPNALVRS